MRVAALDLGSNTSLLLIAEIINDKLVQVLVDESRVTKLGQGVHANRCFHSEALQRMDQCLKDYAHIINTHNCTVVAAVATSAARDVSNSSELLNIGVKYGIPIRIISGEQEAGLTFRGALCDRGATASLAVVDVGGGSTEIISENNGQLMGVSVDVGSVRLSELFVKSHPIAKDQRAQIREYCRLAFARAALPTGSFGEVVAVAGTPTTLAALDQGQEFADDRVHGYRLSLAVIEDWADRLAAMTIEQREQLPGMQPKRADVIVTGAEILAGAIRALGMSAVTVSTRGVRYGVALAWEEFK